MGQISRPDPEKSLESYKLLSFQLLNDAKEEICKFPVAVKNLTTAGVILEILHLDEDLKTDNFKRCEGVLQIIAQDDRTMVELPGKILWTRNREGDSGVTLGVELSEPLSMPLRHALEADMAIGAKDMKVLWDYWDEIQESAVPRLNLPMRSGLLPRLRIIESPQLSEPQMSEQMHVTREGGGIG